MRRLRQEDQTVIEELEREIELVSTDEMRLPLMLYLQQAGLEQVRRIPCGIGSGIAASPTRPSGVFFAFQAGDRHFWRLYTKDADGADEIVSDTRRLFRYPQIGFEDPANQRVMPLGFEVFDWLERATDDVLKEINSALRATRIKPKLGAINMELDVALRQPLLITSAQVASAEELVAPDELREKLQSVVQNVPLDAFKRDKKLKAIREAYRAEQNQRMLAEALDEFFVENELYRDVPTSRSTLEQIKAEDLQLVAFEVFG